MCILKFNEFKSQSKLNLKSKENTIYRSDNLKDLLINGIGNFLNYDYIDRMELEDELVLSLSENNILFEDNIDNLEINILNNIVSRIDISLKVEINSTSINEKDEYNTNPNNISEDDIIEVINSNGSIYTNIVDNYPDHNEDEPLTPISVDNDNVLVDIDGNIHNVDLKYIKKYEL